MLVLFLIPLLVCADQSIFNGTYQFDNSGKVDLTYPIKDNEYVLINNVTYNMSMVNNYNGLFVLSIPCMSRVVGAGNISGTLNKNNMTCEFPIWTAHSNYSVDFLSYGPSNVSYWLTMDYDVGDTNCMICWYITGAVGCVMLIMIVGVYLYFRYRSKRQYQQVV